MFNDLRDRGRTIIFVSHDMGAMQRFCHRALLLERGRPVHMGEPHEVADRYLELNFGREQQDETSAHGHTGDGQARVAEVWLEGPDGERLSSVAQHQRVTLKAQVQFIAEVSDPAAALQIFNDEHRLVLAATTEIENERTGHFGVGEEVVVSFAFDNVLAPGRYLPVFQLTHRGSGLDVIDRFEGGSSFVVTSAGALGGLIDLPVQSDIARTGNGHAGGTRT